MTDIDAENVSRNEEIRRIHRKHLDTYKLLGGGLTVVVLVLVGVAIFSEPQRDYWINVYVTIVGTVLAVFVIDQRAEQRATRQRKEELILQMGSPDNGFAVEAVRLLRQKKWLTDGSLEGAELSYANLVKAELYQANLRNASLIGTVLTDTLMDLVNLSGACMTWVNLTGASLYRASLIGAEIDMAFLTDVSLIGANLTGANLSNVSYG